MSVVMACMLGDEQRGGVGRSGLGLFLSFERGDEVGNERGGGVNR